MADTFQTMNCKPYLVLILLLLQGCVLVGPYRQNDLSAYQKAIKETVLPDSSNICTTLVPITKSNKNLVWKSIKGEDYVLMVSLKSDNKYYLDLDSSLYNTGIYYLWVSAAPELKEKVKGHKNKDVPNRLKQILGLPPTSQYNYFIEFWIRPADLFRPCLDKEITDQKCDACFPANADSTHKRWVNNTRISRYYNCELTQNYPWTQLGYTYDWGKKHKPHIGVSEFVVYTHRNIYVNHIYTIEEYVKDVVLK